MIFPKPIQTLIDAFSKLPGVGKKTAQHYAYFLMRSHRSIAKEMADALTNIERGISLCSECFLICEGKRCTICGNPRRDHRIICVVENIFDVEAIERSGEYTGVYHVLHGRIAPLDNIGPDDIKVKELVTRVRQLSASPEPLEIIIATNPSSEGETTAFYIERLLRPLGVKVTRIATGIPVGADLEYADAITLSRAIKGRQQYGE